MRRNRSHAPAKGWIPLGDPVNGFDQTNGMVPPAEAANPPHPHEYEDPDELARAAAKMSGGGSAF